MGRTYSLRRIVSTTCCSTGQGKRFQPNKPLTKPQAAVAMMSGNMAEAIHTEQSRLEVENSLRQTAMEDIRSDILNKGDIHRYWDGKLEDEAGVGAVAFGVSLPMVFSSLGFEFGPILIEKSSYCQHPECWNDWHLFGSGQHFGCCLLVGYCLMELPGFAVGLLSRVGSMVLPGWPWI
ncbi:hypothetical protein U1Q18_022357 [Sarracenia purpurea var. burkii]